MLGIRVCATDQGQIFLSHTFILTVLLIISRVRMANFNIILALESGGSIIQHLKHVKGFYLKSSYCLGKIHLSTLSGETSRGQLGR